MTGSSLQGSHLWGCKRQYRVTVLRSKSNKGIFFYDQLAQIMSVVWDCPSTGHWHQRLWKWESTASRHRQEHYQVPHWNKSSAWVSWAVSCRCLTLLHLLYQPGGCYLGEMNVSLVGELWSYLRFWTSDFFFLTDFPGSNSEVLFWPRLRDR